MKRFHWKPKPLETVTGLTGWRCMWVVGAENDPVLMGPVQGVSFPTRLSRPAVCLIGREHEAPHRECDCGYYAFTRPPARGDVLGGLDDHSLQVKVSAVGKTVIHEDGWRAEQIRIDAITVPPGFDENIARLLSQRYDISVYEEDNETCRLARQKRQYEQSRSRMMSTVQSLTSQGWLLPGLSTPPFSSQPRSSSQLPVQYQHLYMSGSPRGPGDASHDIGSADFPSVPNHLARWVDERLESP